MNIFDFDNIVFDLDSTLTKIEGIDLLAKLNDREEVALLTQMAMNGEIDFEEIFSKRLDMIQPTLHQVVEVGEEYLNEVVAGVGSLIERLVYAGKRIFVISGGYNPAVKIFTDALGIPRENVFANQLLFDERGQYVNFNRKIPLWRSDGKRIIMEGLFRKFPGEWVSIGDGMSDLQAASGIASFICFCGVVERPAVVQSADFIFSSTNMMDLVRLEINGKDGKLKNYGADFFPH